MSGFVCGECNTAFSTPGRLKDHELRAHVPHYSKSCWDCGASVDADCGHFTVTRIGAVRFYFRRGAP